MPSVLLGNAIKSNIGSHDDDVKNSTWYNGMRWTGMLRAKVRNTATLLAAQMNTACGKNGIHFSDDTDEKDELIDYVDEHGDMSGIQDSDVVYCNSVTLIVACLLCVGIDIREYNSGNVPTTDNIIDVLLSTGQFNFYNDIAHINTCKYTCLGDIFVYKNATGNGRCGIVTYDEYDVLAPEYINIPDLNRTVNFGRLCVSSQYVCDGLAPKKVTAPVDLNELDDFELFMIGMMITGGEGAFHQVMNSSKGVING